MKIDNVLVIGAVGSTVATLEGLLRHGFKVAGVLGHEPENRAAVAGWRDLRAFSGDVGLDYRGFQTLHAASHIEWARQRQPSLIFAVGFSQLLTSAWLELPTIGCVGFHPTCLPKGRGRAPIAWIILEERCAAATFFLMGEGADDGPILVQQPFAVADDDDAASVESKILDSIAVALDDWLPRLRRGEWNPVPQDESQATWYGRRCPEDGLLDWSRTAVEIDRLIKASARPHPGAFTYLSGSRLVVQSSFVENDGRIKGVVGRILAVDKRKGWLVQTGSGLIWINDLDCEKEMVPKVGQKLGLNVEEEIFRILNTLERNDD